MKKLILTLTAFMAVGFFSLATAQIKTPAASPTAKITQNVGLTDITVEYSSPAAKARTIWGDLVPWDKPWRTGANAPTKITFSCFAQWEDKKQKYDCTVEPGGHPVIAIK